MLPALSLAVRSCRWLFLSWGYFESDIIAGKHVFTVFVVPIAWSENLFYFQPKKEKRAEVASEGL